MVLHIQSDDVMTKKVSWIKTCTQEGCYIVLNYATWCGACHAFMPEWLKFEKAAPKGVKLIKVESSAYASLPYSQPSLYKKLTDKGSLYFPMVVMFVDGKKYMFKGERSAEGLKKFVDSKKKPATKKPIKKTA